MAKKILVVDDEPHILKLIKSRLEAHNYQVITAIDGTDCLQKLLLEKPDLILLDVMMPHLDGYSTLIAIKEMKQMNEGVPDVPVIMLTARGEPKVRELIEKEEIKGYIIKPFDAQLLLKTIEEVIGK